MFIAGALYSRRPSSSQQTGEYRARSGRAAGLHRLTVDA